MAFTVLLMVDLIFASISFLKNSGIAAAAANRITKRAAITMITFLSRLIFFTVIMFGLITRQ
ncbi:hypothetical protein [Pedobacter frigidisoli]|uniref:hypothetical protein n=1 Tax=Pedobacter frigidisoli TaxID=2530455 RepID=UPI0021D1C6DD|nr:hypothetical protein [Pedobacter frigidisoli]